MFDDIKAVVTRMPLEVFNQGKLEVIDEVVAPDFVDHSAFLPDAPAGREGVWAYAEAVRRAFPDLHNTINHVIAEGDLVAMHVTSSGTMRGELAGMPPVGKQAVWDAVHITRVRDGKIVEHWAVQDQLGMLQQLGFIPTPTAAESAG